MNHLHVPLRLNDHDIVEVEITGNACNVMLLSPVDFQHYRNRRNFTYYGGHFDRSPARISVPNGGTWHLVLDLGGLTGRLAGNYRIIPAQSSAAAGG